MRIFLIGSGGREHALAWKLSRSPSVEKIFCSPGNGGIAQLAETVPACAANDWASYADFAEQKRIDLTVVGPEAPLVEGIADHFRGRGLRIFGPGRSGARLEGSKAYAKDFMRRHGIPTADFEAFTDPDAARGYIRRRFQARPAPDSLVVKADGLAAGKGVVVCEGSAQAEAAVEKMLVEKAFGKAGETLLIEDRLRGEELSLMAFCDGKRIRALPFAKDYKRVFDGNEGPNTGGMGAIAPCAVAPETAARIERSVVRPFLDAVQKEGMDYRGLIYFGLMLTADGPYVLEFNVRFGDPETQAVLPLIRSDFAQVLAAAADGKLGDADLELHPQACMSVVLASGGYPGRFENHKPISGLESAGDGENPCVFHAGTVRENGRFLTQGGRVLSVSARADTLAAARDLCYAAVARIAFDKMHFRKDIGASNASAPSSAALK